MALDQKLSDWQAAGLIDTATAQAIAAHEAAEARPLARWAAVAIGLLALALGGSLLVAANWDVIPAALKLAVHGAATIAAAAVAWFAERRPRLREAALFLLGGLVVAGVSLQDQIYQIPQPVWSLLGLSALLVAPAILLAGATRLTAIGWGLQLAVAAVAYVGDMPRDMSAATILAGNLPAALPPALILLSLLMPPERRQFALGLRDTGLALLLAGASLAHFGWAVAVPARDAAAMATRLPLALGVSLVSILLAKRSPVLRAALGAAAIAVPLAIAIPHGDALGPRLFGAFAFLGLWAVVARAASAEGWRALFGIAVAAIALRLFVIYFELFGSLASTGIGLVAGGALLVGLALAWDRVVRKTRA